MPTVATYNQSGVKVGEIQLNDAVFGVEVNEAVMHQAVVRQLSNERLGTHATNTRSFLGSVAITVPCLPLSLPEITTTVSPFLICSLAICCVPPSYNTSGAKETIFMKSFSRSSLATGPKIRVPRGVLSSLITTAAFSSKRI